MHYHYREHRADSRCPPLPEPLQAALPPQLPVVPLLERGLNVFANRVIIGYVDVLGFGDITRMTQPGLNKICNIYLIAGRFQSP